MDTKLRLRFSSLNKRHTKGLAASNKINCKVSSKFIQRQQQRQEVCPTLVTDSNLGSANYDSWPSKQVLRSHTGKLAIISCQPRNERKQIDLGDRIEHKIIQSRSLITGDGEGLTVSPSQSTITTLKARKVPSRVHLMVKTVEHYGSVKSLEESHDIKQVSMVAKRQLNEFSELSKRSLNLTNSKASKRARFIDNSPASETTDIGDVECSCSCGRQRPAINTRSELSKIPDLYNETTNDQNSRRSSLFRPQKLINLGDNNRRIICNRHMPWFGIDVGGSLVKVVFFDPKDALPEELNTLRHIRRHLKSSKAYGTTGKRDAHLEMPNCVINRRAGSLHFIRFSTNQMPEFLRMAQNKGFADTVSSVCATGGGAYKFEEDIRTNLGISLHTTDELDSIIHGIQYIDKYNPFNECYFLQDPLDDLKCVKIPYDFSRPYPFLVVNIGSGVSILAVYSSTSYSRISGSSIGGGTFLGLCCLLTQCKTFEEAIRLAKAGTSTKIDKLVKDIYGGDYLKFDLSGDTVASSFGHMNIAEKRKDVKREDLARALLEMVTINIGSIARMCAANENMDRVVFIGNFLRVNQLSMKLLSYAVNYWSKGAMKALFLEHEGYFGAVGCFVESTQGCMG